MTKTAAGYKPSMSDEAVKKKTGKTWPQWFAALDKAKAMKLGHPAIADMLHEKFAVPGWWSQMVTVEYELARGLRARNQLKDGYSLSVSKTLPLGAAALYRNVADAKSRGRWFPKGKLEVKSATEQKYFRAKWNGGTRLEINVYAKGDGKAQIAVQHSKFLDADAMEAMRGKWKKALAKLSEIGGAS
jgi:hypothetical protein